MLISAFAALALFAAPEATQSGDADAKPAMQRVCYKVEAAGSSVPKRKCVMKPVKVADRAESAESADDKAADAAKSE